MGLSIHYSGNIRDISMIEALVSETADICKSLEWDFHVLEYPNDDMLNGIIFSPPGSEPVVLTYLPSGRLCSPFNLVNKALYGQNGLDTELLYTSSTKTQYAGADTHEILIKLLRYFKDKYFAAFELEDESMYWETMDRGVLLSQFAKYDYLLDTTMNKLGEMGSVEREPIATLAERIEQMMRDRLTRPD